MSSPLIMVSSVVRGFEGMREAARDAITKAGGLPLLVNEDLPALTESPRNACLDAVAKADAYLVIVGERGGFTAPSGKPVVEEELDEALRRHKPVLAFIQECRRDEAASQLVQKIENFVSGKFRISFRTADDLRGAIETGVRGLVGQSKIPLTDSSAVQDALLRETGDVETPSLRCVVAPIRKDELIDPRQFERDGLAVRFVEIAHAQKVGLLSFENRTKQRLEGERLIVESFGSSRGEARLAKLTVSELGWIETEIRVPDAFSEGESAWGASFLLAEEHLNSTAMRSLAFAQAVLDLIDPYQRSQSIVFNAALRGLGSRAIERNPKPRNSFSMNSWGEREALIVAYERPRELSRVALSSPADEVDRAVYLIVRQSKPSQ